MTFTVEDGTGLNTANSYATVTEFNSYWDLRGFVHSSYTDAQKQVALVKATDYIELRYRVRFIGTREFETQALSFPRLSLYDEDGRKVLGVPKQLKNATIEYAKRALTAELVTDPEESGKVVQRKKEKVGPLEEETEYVLGGHIITYKSYPAADKLLKEYLGAGGGRVVR